ncbi:MAG: 30S ribosome-binding factor RbfA [Synergistes sp.]|nr:30S ribosome-binding factor RbfA [Synergistes sp.]MCR5336061.1 30S ribosome-binding factor RbfA [Synergistes sp.]
MTTYRIDRINKELLRLISEMLMTRIKNDDAAKAVLTKASVSRDLSFARVYYTVIKADERAAVQTALDAAAVPLRAMLGKELKLRTIPELHFIYDDSEDKAREMDDLLDRVAALEMQKAAEKEAES